MEKRGSSAWGGRGWDAAAAAAAAVAAVAAVLPPCCLLAAAVGSGGDGVEVEGLAGSGCSGGSA